VDRIGRVDRNESQVSRTVIIGVRPLQQTNKLPLSCSTVGRDRNEGARTRPGSQIIKKGLAATVGSTTLRHAGIFVGMPGSHCRRLCWKTTIVTIANDGMTVTVIMVNTKSSKSKSSILSS